MCYSKQRGSALMVAVFVMTVMAVMAAAMIRIDWSGQTTTTREVLATRAWFAAHSGNEYLLSRLFPLGQSTADASVCQGQPIRGLDAALFQCRSLTLRCETFEVGTTPYQQYYLTATATCGSGEMAVTRTQETWARELE